MASVVAGGLDLLEARERLQIKDDDDAERPALM